MENLIIYAVASIAFLAYTVAETSYSRWARFLSPILAGVTGGMLGFGLSLSLCAVIWG